MSRLASLVALGLAFLAPVAEADDKAERAVQVSRAAVGQYLPDLAFTSADGRTVRLTEFLGKPLMLTMIYTSCVDVCPTLIENLYPAVKAAQQGLGTDSFAVVTVGFDVRDDTPTRLRAFARTRGVDLPNWSFLAGDAETLDALAKAVGFAFYSRPGGFDHLSQVSMFDRDGRLDQQIYGAVFDPPVIVEPLKNLVFNRSAPLSSLERLVDRVKYFCTVYDPKAGRYYFNYSLFMTIGIGIACFSLVFVVMVREWRRPRPDTGRS